MTKTTTSSATTATSATKNGVCQRFLATTVGKWLSSKTAVELASCQRGEVFDASFVRGLKTTCLNHWPIAPVCVTEDKADGKPVYVLFDGQQRTAAMREARKTCNAMELEAFDSAPLFLEIVALPEDLPEGEFFRYRNTNNAPTKAQASLGNYSGDVRDIIHAVTVPSLVGALYARRTKSDGLEIARVGKLDDLVQALALSLVSPRQASTNFGDVSKALESISSAGIEAETKARALERAQPKCDAIASALRGLASAEDLKKLYRAACMPKVLVPLFMGTGTDPEAVLATIRSLFGDDGKAVQCAPIVDYTTGEGVPPVAIDWYTLMTSDRSNGAGVNNKRAAFVAREYARAKAALAIKRQKDSQIENEMESVEAELPEGL